MVSRTAKSDDEAAPVNNASPAIVRMFPASYVSAAFDLRKAVESRLSRVSAFEVRQLPLMSEKQPPLSEMPLSRVDVAPDESCSDPPVMDIPSPDVRPPNVAPPVNDDVAESVKRMVPPDISRPEVELNPAAVSPPVNVEVEVFCTCKLGMVVEPNTEMMLVARMLPPIMVIPESVTNPPPPIDVIPPWNVDVAPSPRIVVVAVVEPMPRA